MQMRFFVLLATATVITSTCDLGSSSRFGATLMAADSESPHDYLCKDNPQRAIEMMAADSSWIAKKDEDSCTPLHHAARYGHLEAVRWLLDHDADINATAYNGFTPLHLTDDPKVIQTILQKKPDLTISALGRTALQQAAEKFVNARKDQEREKWRQIVKLYQDAGADYDLLTAISLDDFQRVKTILQASPRLADDFQQQSPLRHAASRGRLEICKYLIEEHRVDVNDFERGAGYSILKEAVAFPDVVRLLIKNGADLTARITWRGVRAGVWIIGDEATVLHFAADDGVPETIKLLIDGGVDIFATDSFGQTPLQIAAFSGKAENAKAIVSHPKFDVAERQSRQAILDKCLLEGAFPSWLARNTERSKLIKVLLDKGANPNANENGVTAMKIAASEIHPGQDWKNPEIVKIVAILREHGASVDFFSAVAIGDGEQVKGLLAKNPGLANSRGPDGYPALHLATKMDYKAIVSSILQAGGNVDIRNKAKRNGYFDETALHCAASWDRHEIARLLIDAGADVNALGERRITPLHHAARFAYVKIVRLLFESGANPTPRDKNGQTPLDWCRELNRQNAAETEKLLREYDQNQN